jgi:hypothetical protein
MKHLAAAALLAALPAASHAETLPEGVSFSGFVEAETLFLTGESRTYGITQLDFSYRSAAPLSAGIGWGFDLGLDGLATQGDTARGLSGGVVLTFGQGELVIGAPRGPMEQLLDFPEIGGSRVFGLELFMLGGNLVKYARLLGESDLLGLRYDHNFGATDVSLGYFDADGQGLTEIALRHQINNYTFVLGADFFNQGDSQIIIGAVLADWGKIDAGLKISSVDMGKSTGEIIEAFGSYDISDRLSATASVVRVQDFIGSTLYGVSANYDVTQNLYVRGGLVGFDDSETIYSLTIGAKF